MEKKEEENSTLVSKISRLESDAQGEQPSWRRCPSQLDENSLLKMICAPKMTESLKFKKLTALLDSERVLAKLMDRLPNRVLWSTGFWAVQSGDSLSTSDLSGSYEAGNISSSGNVPIADSAQQKTSCFCVLFASHLDLFA